MDLVTERGYHNVTIADIADTAGVSRRTFSNYFSSKAACLIEVSEAETAQLIPTIIDGDPANNLTRRVSIALGDLSEQFYADVAALHRLRIEEPEVMSAMARADEENCGALVEQLLELTDHKPDRLRVKVVIAAVFAAINACMEYWLEQGSTGGTRRLASLIEETLTIVDLSFLDEYADLARSNLA